MEVRIRERKNRINERLGAMSSDEFDGEAMRAQKRNERKSY